MLKNFEVGLKPNLPKADRAIVEWARQSTHDNYLKMQQRIKLSNQMTIAFYSGFKLQGFADFAPESGQLQADPQSPEKISDLVEKINSTEPSINLESFDRQSGNYKLFLKKIQRTDPEFRKSILQQAALGGFFAISVPDKMRPLLEQLEQKNLEEKQKISLLNALADAADSEKEEIAEVLHQILSEKT